MKRTGSLLRDPFNLDAAFGFLMGFAAGASLFVLMHGGIREWQDLTAGILALIGGAGAVFAVTHQIRHAQEMEDERRHRQLYAARSMLPHTLTEVCDYAERCCTALRFVLGQAKPPTDLGRDGVQFPAMFEIPPITDIRTEPLQQMLQFGDREIQNNISSFIQFLQVQQSRLKIRNKPSSGASFYYGRIADAVEIYARANILFDYSRGLTEGVPAGPNQSDMDAAAKNCGFWHPAWDELKTYIHTHWRPYTPLCYEREKT